MFGCVQRKPGDSKCHEKARDKCTKVLEKIAVEDAKLRGKIELKCNDDLAFGVLASEEGANLEALTSDCAVFGGGVSSLADYAECLVRQHECLVEELVLFQAPRAEELLGFLNPPLTIRSRFCPLFGFS